MNKKQKKPKSPAKSASKRKIAIKDLKVKGGAEEIKGGIPWSKVGD